MRKIIAIIRTDAETGKRRTITLNEALVRLSPYYKNLRTIRKCLVQGQTLRTPYAFYKERV